MVILMMPTGGKMDLKSKVIKLSQRMGCPIVNRRCNPYAWDGQTIALRETRKPRHISHLVHDIAHFLVAIKKRKSIPDFGLGIGPDSPPGAKYLKPIIPDRQCQEEEEMASILGILIEKEIGSDWKWTWDYHSWNVEINPADVSNFLHWRVKPILAKLRKKKLIDKKLKPLCV